MFCFVLKKTSDHLQYHVYTSDHATYLGVLVGEVRGADYLMIRNFLLETKDYPAPFEQVTRLLGKNLSTLLFCLYLNGLKTKQISNTKEFWQKLFELCQETKFAVSQAIQVQLTIGIKDDSQNYYLAQDFLDLQNIWQYYLLKNQVDLRSCEICSAPFLISKRRHGKLCAYKHLSGETCTDIKSKKQRLERLDKDPALSLYKRIYKRNYMRCDRYLTRHKNNFATPGTDPVFQNWLKKLQAAKEAYEQAQLCSQNFISQLKQLDDEYRLIDLERRLYSKKNIF